MLAITEAVAVERTSSIRRHAILYRFIIFTGFELPAAILLAGRISHYQREGIIRARLYSDYARRWSMPRIFDAAAVSDASRGLFMRAIY